MKNYWSLLFLLASTFSLGHSFCHSSCSKTQKCYIDVSCKNGGLGCGVGGVPECRFCEFGIYKFVKCTYINSITPAPAPVSKGRQLTFINNCNENIRIGYTGGYSGNAVNGACAIGQILNPSNNFCYWDFIQLKDINKRMLLPKQKLTIDLIKVPGFDARFSGNVYGSTKCDSTGKCLTGTCGNGVCLPYVGATGPVTRAEFTLVDTGTDFYDISIIDGINVPLEIRVDNSSKDVFLRETDKYFGGNGGGAISLTGLANCSWKVDPIIDGIYGNKDYSYVFKLVKPTTTTLSYCKKDMDCLGSKQVCGSMENPFKSGVCGQFLGYWSAISICANSGLNIGEPLFCDELTGQDATSTRGHMFSCGGPIYSQSGYQPGDNATFIGCGCIDWIDESVYAPAEKCKRVNPFWKTYAMPILKILKKACPTSYSYAYCDASSTMVYSNKNATKDNDASYIITYCPGESANFWDVPDKTCSLTQEL
jgi:hypothetical protein